MSNRYKGGIISATPPTTTGGESGTASGAWTLEQQMQAQAAGLWPIQPPPLYIEDVFSTWLYTGNGATQTITNGIDLAGKGGLVWTKCRSLPEAHMIFDTERGIYNRIFSNSTNAQSTSTNTLTAFNSDGFSIGDNNIFNTSGSTNASWTFRKQQKFFDCVTWTGNGVSGRAIPHNLGSAPGFIAVKILSAADNWECYHRGIPFNSANVLWLNSTNGVTTGGARFTSEPNATDFFVGSDSGVNGSGQTYVAYLFAHDAGGFGPTESENVISCGSFTNASDVNLGYEPQWILLKRTSSAQNWFLLDTMRGWLAGSDTASVLSPNLSDAETSTGLDTKITSTGFTTALSGTYIYIAIRRGPMKTPTSGTSVFVPVLQSAGGTVTTGFPVDLSLSKDKTSSLSTFIDRLRGDSTTYFNYLSSTNTDAETTGTGAGLGLDSNTGYRDALFGGGSGRIYWNFRRAPGFFDEVCWTGDNTTSRSISHNLQAAPELIIRKSRSASGSWSTLTKFETSTYIELNLNSASEGSVRSYAANQYLSAKPTSTVFTVNPSYENDAGVTYVSYLFATCPGVSKVGFYTGTGTTQTINCGFTAGSRFVLIKRYDPDFSGDWYVWDSARGIVAGNDPYLLLNSTAAEVTNTDFIDTTSVGFEISSTAPAAINASGGTFIFLAIA